MSTKSRLVDFRVIKESVTMEDALRRYGILEIMNRSGDNLAGCCPIHKGTVRIKRNAFHGEWNYEIQPARLR